jgi:hypothetical protein
MAEAAGAGEGMAARDDAILWPVRLLGGVIVVVLVLAVIVLYGMPEETEQYWAWTINPPMTPLLMGAGYAAGAYFFLHALLGRSWRSITLGFLPITVFTSMLLIATLLHWENFNHSHVAFFAWTFLYATTPFIVPAAWLLNRRHDPGRQDSDLLVPNGSRLALALVGVLIGAVALVTFASPSTVIEEWPWALSPLTGRTVAAYLGLTGATLVLIAWDARWRAGKVLVESLMIGSLLIVIGILRDWGNLHPDAVVRWSYLGGMVLGVVLLAGLYLGMEARRRAAVGTGREEPVAAE